MNHAGLQIDAENPFEFETLAASVLLETTKLVHIPPLVTPCQRRAADTAAGNTHPALASCAGAVVSDGNTCGVFQDTFFLPFPAQLSTTSSS